MNEVVKNDGKTYDMARTFSRAHRFVSDIYGRLMEARNFGCPNYDPVILRFVVLAKEGAFDPYNPDAQFPLTDDQYNFVMGHVEEMSSKVEEAEAKFQQAIADASAAAFDYLVAIRNASAQDSVSAVAGLVDLAHQEYPYDSAESVEDDAKDTDEDEDYDDGNDVLEGLEESDDEPVFDDIVDADDDVVADDADVDEVDEVDDVDLVDEDAVEPDVCADDGAVDVDADSDADDDSADIDTDDSGEDDVDDSLIDDDEDDEVETFVGLGDEGDDVLDDDAESDDDLDPEIVYDDDDDDDEPLVVDNAVELLEGRVLEDGDDLEDDIDGDFPEHMEDMLTSKVFQDAVMEDMIKDSVVYGAQVSDREVPEDYAERHRADEAPAALTERECAVINAIEAKGSMDFRTLCTRTGIPAPELDTLVQVMTMNGYLKLVDGMTYESTGKA